jgi:hypothetical protein
MRGLRPVPIVDADVLAEVVADSLGEVEPGLAVLERGFGAGETVVDLLAVDERGGLVVVGVTAGGEPAAVLRILEGVAWCREHAPLVTRAFGSSGVRPAAPLRSLLVTGQAGERLRRLLRLLGEHAPAAVVCRVFELSGERCVAYEPVTGVDGGPERRSAHGAPALAPSDAPTADTEPSAADRARRLIDRLEALRFRQMG